MFGNMLITSNIKTKGLTISPLGGML